MHCLIILSIIPLLFSCGGSSGSSSTTTPTTATTSTVTCASGAVCPHAQINVVDPKPLN